MVDSRTHSGSIEIAAAPEQVYGVVADVTRTGEWSPVCESCWWDEDDAPAAGDAPRVGARFTGRNVTPERTWETRCTIVTSEPGRAIGWVVGDGLVRWGYEVEPGPTPSTTLLTETWEFTASGLEAFAERYGSDADNQIAQRTRMAHEGIPATLAAIRAVIEN